jgi:hypothetical protein
MLLCRRPYKRTYDSAYVTAPDDEMLSLNSDTDAVLRRLLVGLERPEPLDEWRRRRPVDEVAAMSAEERHELPKSAWPRLF